MPDYSLNWTTGPVLYKGDKGVNDAAHPPEAGGLSASSLLLMFNAHPAWMPDSPTKKPGRKASSKLMLLALSIYKTYKQIEIIFYTQLNAFKYRYQTLIVLFAHS